MIQIGIDCGVKTGFAVAEDGDLQHVTTETITQAMQTAKERWCLGQWQAYVCGFGQVDGKRVWHNLVGKRD